MNKFDLSNHIEVEIGTYCNRSCSWCPNNYSDRGETKEYINENLWSKILEELSVLEFKGDFCFHNYNEPLIDPSILNKVSQAKIKIPNANLVIYTNGDYLSLDILESLHIAGLTKLIVTLYPSGLSNYTSESIEEFCDSLNLEVDTQFIKSNKNCEVRTRYLNIQIVIRYPDFLNFNNRGESVKLKSLDSNHPRTKPCFSPYFSASIDYLGNLKMCCNIYDSSSIKNKPYIIGNLNTESLFNLWNSKKLESIRSKLSSANFDQLPICLSCKRTELESCFVDNSSQEEVISMIRVLRSSRMFNEL